MASIIFDGVAVLFLAFGQVPLIKSAGPDHPKLAPIDVRCVDPNAAPFATFHSHNEKIVQNGHGVFMAYMRQRDDVTKAAKWRLLRSIDAGDSFSTIYEASHKTDSPAVVTDSDDNIYLLRGDYVADTGQLYRFLAAEDYAKPHLTEFPHGRAGKFCAALDGKRQRLYFVVQSGHMTTFDLNGAVLSCNRIIEHGKVANLQYPHIQLGPDGVLHVAWTTNIRGTLYRAIHYMYSPDGGVRWKNLSGEELLTPVAADELGRSDRITLDDEFDVSTWLSNFLAYGGKLHFMYMRRNVEPPHGQHYMRYDCSCAEREIDIYPDFRGQRLEIKGVGGFFAAGTAAGKGAIYAVGCGAPTDSGYHVTCLASDDNGDSWYDYAESSSAFGNIYSLSGSRQITPDGYILGAFTDRSADPPRMYFLKIKAKPE